MKKITSVSKEQLIYLDESGSNRFIDFEVCNQNYLRGKKEIGVFDRKIVGHRDIYSTPPHISFITAPTTHFEFSSADELYDIINQMRKFGWRTIDLD